MCVPKNIIKPISTTINEKGKIKLSIECIKGYSIESHIEDVTENSTENMTVELDDVTPQSYVPHKFEKLLTNISNKLGLSFAIYQK